MSNTAQRYRRIEELRFTPQAKRKLTGKGRKAAKRRAEAVQKGMERRAQFGAAPVAP